MLIKNKKQKRGKGVWQTCFRVYLYGPKLYVYSYFFLLNGTKGGMYENVLVIKMMYCDWSVARYLSMTHVRKAIHHISGH